MILTNKKEKLYRLEVNKGVFARICKEIQLKSELKIGVLSEDENMIASAIITNNSSSYILTLSMINGVIGAFLIEPKSAGVRYYTELKTCKLDTSGELVRCKEDDLNKYIDDFVSEVILICK